MSPITREQSYACAYYNKDADQHAHLRSLISIFVIPSLDSMKSQDASSFLKDCDTFRNPEDRLSRDGAQMSELH